MVTQRDRLCIRCRKRQSIEEFRFTGHIDRHGKQTLRHVCRECERLRRRNNYQEQKAITEVDSDADMLATPMARRVWRIGQRVYEATGGI